MLKRVLIIQTAFIGDVILATPLAEAIHAAYPEARIDFLVRKGNEGLLTGHPFLNKVLVWNKQQGKYRNLLALLRQIRSLRYDLVLNCQRFAASGFLAAFSGAQLISGFDKNPFSRFFHHRIPHTIGNGQYETERNLALLEPLGITGDRRPRLYPPPLDFVPEQPYVCMAPASVWFTKQWPEHKWVELIQRMPPETRVYLMGSPADAALCERIATAANRPRTENLCGKLSLLQSAALMQGAVMNYVNDSAPLHLCSAVNAPVTTIFCSTVPAFGFGPLSEQSYIIETPEKLACRPCGLHGYKACPERHFRCAEGIEVRGVVFRGDA